MTIIVYKKSNGKIVRVYHPLWNERAFWGPKNYVTGSGLKLDKYAQQLYDTDNVDLTEDKIDKGDILKPNGKKYKPFDKKKKKKKKDKTGGKELW